MRTPYSVCYETGRAYGRVCSSIVLPCPRSCPCTLHTAPVFPHPARTPLRLSEGPYLPPQNIRAHRRKPAPDCSRVRYPLSSIYVALLEALLSPDSPKALNLSALVNALHSLFSALVWKRPKGARELNTTAVELISAAGLTVWEVNPRAPKLDNTGRIRTSALHSCVAFRRFSPLSHRTFT